MLFSYLFYLFVLFACIVIACLADKYNSTKLRNLLIGLLVGVTGFRGYEVGIDTPHYVDIWDAVMWDLPVYQELGFQYLIRILQEVSTNPTTLFVTCSVIIYLPIIIRLWDFRRIASFPIMIAVLYMLFFMQSMNTMRQYCAISIVFFFTRYLFQKQYLKYCLGVLLASSLHASSLLGFFFLGFEVLKWKSFSFRRKIFFAFFVIVGLIFGVVAYRFAYDRYGHYFEEQEKSLGVLTILLFFAISCSYCMSKLWKKRVGIEPAEINGNKFIIKVSFVSYIVGVFLQSLGYFFPFVSRISLLFVAFGIVFWGILFKLTVRKSLKVIYFLLMIILVGLPFALSIYGNGFGTMPYSFCW